MPKLVWQVKLVAELEPGVATETEVARIERDEEVGLADLGLRLEEVKGSMQNSGGRLPARPCSTAGFGRHTALEGGSPRPADR